MNMAFSVGLHGFQVEVNTFLELKNVPFRCIVSVKPDGNCFFRAIFWQMDKEDVWNTLPPRARKIKDHFALRKAAIRFMEWNEVLLSIDTFQEYKKSIDGKEGWLNYLRRMKEYGEWADDCIIWCTALFLGKDIMAAGDTNDKKTPWTLYPGFREGTTFKSTLPPVTVAYLSQRHYEPIERQLMKVDNECKGCASTGKSIPAHVFHKSNGKLCKTFYDVEELRTITKESHKRARKKYKEEHPEAVKRSHKKHKENHPEARKESLKRSHKKHKENNPEAVKESLKRSHKKHKENNPEAEKRYSKEYSDRNLEQIRKRKKEYHKKGRDAFFSNLDEKKRYKRFKEAIQDCFGFVCLCCHRVLSKTAGRANHTLKRLEDDLTELNPKLFTQSIDPDIPEGAKVQEDEEPDKVFLCSTCRKWLFEKKKMPPQSSCNGLKAEKIPTVLEELNDLEKTLIAKRILFLKIVQLPTSRWRKNEGKTTNVPILDNDLLETLNKLETFPRKPDEAGFLPVKLKRKLEYKNKHVEAYVRPEHLRAALVELKNLKHPGYVDVKISTAHFENHMEDRSSSDECSSDNEKEENNITRHQIKLGRDTMMTDNYPESTMVVNTSYETVHKKMNEDSEVSCPIAPGEGKIPTNLMRDLSFDTFGFPDLHPSGKFGLNHKRDQNISALQYFMQRLLNVDNRWAKNPAYLFVAAYYLERFKLERQINLSYRKGTLENRTLMDVEDLFSIFDNVPGSHRYWQKRRYEVIAKLEQLGSFQFFFTLSCADKRWDEGFVAILRQRGLKIRYEPRTEEDTGDTESKYSYLPDTIWVKERGKKEVLLEEYLEDESLHEIVRENVLTVTRCFDARVRAFLNKIVMCPSNPMKAQFFHYRVEFALRGAGHIHGVIWVNLKELEESFRGITSVMTKLRTSTVLDNEEKKVTAEFVDKFVSCSLDDKHIADIVRDVQIHKHTSTCYKKGKTCRFNFPRFPSDRTIIAQPLVKKQEQTEQDFKKEKKKLKETLSKVKAVLEGIQEDAKIIVKTIAKRVTKIAKRPGQTEQDLEKEKETVKQALSKVKDQYLKNITIEDVLQEAGVSKKDYYEALETSSTGACVILKRKVNEMNINNFNPEWIKAWDGNMDIAVCLDFFAVITYITDYYTKGESGKLLQTLVTAAKACSGQDKKQQMLYLAHTFLTHREKGESEAAYGLLPSLHLSHSNLKCEYLATGFLQNRYKFMMKAAQNTDKPDEECGYNKGEEESQNVEATIEIPGHEGKFIAATTKHELYANRPAALENICLAQFVISYDKIGISSKIKKIVFTDGISGTDSDSHIASSVSDEEIILPSYLRLRNNKGYMRLRAIPKVLRHHKFREDKDAHEYIYSELLMYRPWRNENEELHPSDYDACLDKFQEKEDCESNKNKLIERTKIEAVKDILFPHKNNVEEARAIVEECSDQRPQHMGDVLDPQLQKENEEQAAEGDHEIDDLAAREPLGLPDEESQIHAGRSIYKRVDIRNGNDMLRSVRTLDPDQRFAFDLIIAFVKQLRSSQKSGCKKPKPVLLKIHGGAGSGKSKLINDIAAWVEYWMSFAADKDPEHPSVVKAAFTGRASSLIKGLTLSTAFKLEFGNNHTSLPEQTRGQLSILLSNLTVLIIDEMSMVKSDMLYQLDLRLKEVKGCPHTMFGGVSVILVGDLMQLRPVMQNWIFEEPKNREFQATHAIHSLWEQFQAVELKTNHRQGIDKEYGDLLNRIRVGRHTQADLDLLKTRLTNNFPPDALYVYGKRDPVRKQNQERLSLLRGETESMKARNIHPHLKNYKPPVGEDGLVATTPFLDELVLKVDARVMIIYNVDTSDCLTNGTCGVVEGFTKENGKVGKVLLTLDEPEAGQELRKKNRARLEKLEMPHVTPIGRCSFEYSMGRREKQHTTKAKVIQFPLMLAWAVTAHKFQGGTVKSPAALVVDMDSIHDKGGAKAYGMAYVMLSRVQNLKQLHLKSYDPKKIMINEGSLKELNKIHEIALNNQPPTTWMSTNTFLLKIVSLNIRSLSKYLEDLERDPTIQKCDILCLQETFLSRSQGLPKLPGHTCFLSGYGRGRGTAAFVKNRFAERTYLYRIDEWDYDAFQGLKLFFRDFHLINIYRPPNQASGSHLQELLHKLESAIDDEEDTIICGDFNFEYWKQPKNKLSAMLKSKGFVQVVKEATTIHGKCIDHLYVRTGKLRIRYQLHYPHYSDHEAVCFMVKKILCNIQND